MGSANTQATRSTLQSVDTTLSKNINATQNYIPVASTTNFSTSVVAEIESTNEVVSFNDISKNDFQRSEEFDNAYWTKHNSSISANAITAPDGTLTADELIEDSTSSVMHNVQRSFVVFASNPNGIGFSCFAKSKTRTKFYLAYGATNNMQSRAEFNLATGAATTTNPFGFTASASMEDFGNGWFRCKFFFTTGGSAYNPNVYLGLADASGNTVYNGDGSSSLYIWGAQQELNDSTISTYLPTTSSALVGLTGVTRGVNGTTAQAASSGDSIQQLPYALGSLDMPVRLRAISVSPDGTGNARLTLCDNNGDTLCDVDIPNAKSYTFNMPEEGIIFPNGVFISNTDNITAYTVYTEKYSGPGLTS